MSDKYDEVANKIIMDYFQADNYNYDQEGVIALLKRVFPPPAEDARQLLVKIESILEEWYCGAPYERCADDAAAEISRFAESCVEPWREAMLKIANYANVGARVESLRIGTGSTNHYSVIESWARALLSDSPAKEAAK